MSGDYLTCWADATHMPGARGPALGRRLRHPLGLAHAVALGANTTLCGVRRVLDHGTDWPEGAQDLCPECLRLAADTG